MSTPDTRRADLAWLAALGLPVALEAVALRRGLGEWTLSAWVRRRVRPDRPAGRALFLGAWLGFAAWFARHIIITPARELSHG